MAIHDLNTAAVGGYAMPGLVQYRRELDWAGTSRPSQYLPRHETFHLFQLEYIGLRDLAPGLRVLWLLEATAEWAAHQVEGQHPATDGSGSRYGANLTSFLREPNHLTDLHRFRVMAPHAYGAFLFFEYLEETLPAGSDIVRQIWDITGDGLIPKAATKAIEETIEANGGTLADTLAGFAAANYRIEQTYTDPDRADWVRRLEKLGKRPALAGGHALDPAAVGVFAGRHGLADGGAAYVEFVADGATEGTLTVTVDPAADLRGEVFRMVQHPDLCGDAAGGIVPVALGTPTEIPITPDCPEATLMLVRVDLGADLRSVSWQARWHPGSPTSTEVVNGGFETGDLSGWAFVEPDGGNLGVVTAPVHGGGFAARIEPLTATTVGLSQRIDVDQWNHASAWVALDAGSQAPAQVTLELVAVDGTVVAATTRTLTTAGSWQRLDVTYPLGSGTVWYRVTVDGVGAIVYLDDASLGIVL
ncbi:MAG TPA: hypothetical protein ENK55_00555 [Actinobacteria bacterium]|nr:hypothetical protein [Actinomycetota bacterium]